MKKLIILSLLSALAGSSQAQTFAEWWQQKKTQIKYLGQQIAALQVYAGYLEKGYDIAGKGLSVIKDIKKGEFDLHNVFFTSLKVVNSKVSSYSRIEDIISCELVIVKDFKKILLVKNLSSGEKNYLSSVYANMIGECTKSLNRLIDLITDGTYQMTDDERIGRIDDIYVDMKDKYVFIKHFAGRAQLLSVQRELERNNIDMSRTNYGLK